MNIITNLSQFPVWQGGVLRCIARRKETQDSASFDLAPDTPARFNYKPGQFVTVGIDIDGKRHYRAYSMSSSPLRTDAITITVRRLPDGLVSNYLLDNFQVDGRLESSVPAGEFYLAEDHTHEKLLMLSAGSGVTPVMSMTRWLLDRQPDANIHFIYSARSEQDIIFREELLAIAKRHPNFKLDLFLDNTEDRPDRHAGFLTPERLNDLVKDAAPRRLFLCGNQPYMDMVEGWYRAHGLPADRFHKESFKPESLSTAVEGGEVFQLSVPKFGKILSIQAGQTLLEIMEPNAIPIIGACRSGVCGSCKCKIVEGEVERLSIATLTSEEVAAGFALACSTRAKSDVVVDLAL